MLAYIFQIKMFEVSVTVGMKMNYNEDDFHITHFVEVENI